MSVCAVTLTQIEEDAQLNQFELNIQKKKSCPKMMKTRFG
jgi:hypothetical protein